MNMLLKKQIKVSTNFGEDYILSIIQFLQVHFKMEYIGKVEVEMDLIFYHYRVNGAKVTFLSEGQNGTSIIARKTIINKITEKVSSHKPELFE